VKKALITRISGQGGRHVAEYLLGMEYQVYGLGRREPNGMHRLEPFYHQLELVFGDL